MGEPKEATGRKAAASPRGKYRRHSEEEKRRIVAETYAPGASVAVVARRNEVNANQVFNWRRHYRKENSVLKPAPAALMPVGVIAPASSSAPLVENNPMALRGVPASAPLSLSAPPEAKKLIEIEVRGGTRIRVDGNIKGEALRQVLKLVRGLA